MNLKVVKSNLIDFHPYSIMINDEKYNLENNFNKTLNQNTQNVVFVKTYWFKTNKIVLDNNHKNCTLIIDFIVKTKIWVLLMLMFFLLIILNFIIKNYFLNKLTVCFSIIWMLFQLYIYTFGHKKYIKLRVEYSDN